MCYRCVISQKIVATLRKIWKKFQQIIGIFPEIFKKKIITLPMSIYTSCRLISTWICRMWEKWYKKEKWKQLEIRIWTPLFPNLTIYIKINKLAHWCWLHIWGLLWLCILLWTYKPPYILCHLFRRICWQKCRQFQLYLAARCIRITCSNITCFIKSLVAMSQTRSHQSQYSISKQTWCQVIRNCINQHWHFRTKCYSLHQSI